jgi:hypothetical protein
MTAAVATTAIDPSPNELSPLVGGPTTNQYERRSHDNDRYSLRRRWWTYGGIIVAVTVVALTVGLNTMSLIRSSRNKNDSSLETMNPTVQADFLFAGLLVDEKGFYFPMETKLPPTERHEKFSLRRRSMQATTTTTAATPTTGGGGGDGGGDTVDWSFDWQTKAKDGAAIGEYYKAKGLAIADYYRTKFDVSFVCFYPIHSRKARENDDC